MSNNLQNQLNELKTKITELEAQIKQNTKPEMKFWHNGAVRTPLENGQEYWGINSFGKTDSYDWDGGEFDLNQLKTKNCFLTEEACIEWARIKEVFYKYEAKIMEIHDAEGWEANFKNTEQDKYSVYWDYDTDKKEFGWSYNVMTTDFPMSKKAMDYMMSSEVSDEDFKDFIKGSRV